MLLIFKESGLDSKNNFDAAAKSIRTEGIGHRRFIKKFGFFFEFKQVIPLDYLPFF